MAESTSVNNNTFQETNDTNTAAADTYEPPRVVDVGDAANRILGWVGGPNLDWDLGSKWEG